MDLAAFGKQVILMCVRDFLTQLTAEHLSIFQADHLEETCLAKVAADGFAIVGWEYNVFRNVNTFIAKLCTNISFRCGNAYQVALRFTGHYDSTCRISFPSGVSSTVNAFIGWVAGPFRTLPSGLNRDP
jgi:hypothetical protein